MQKCVFRESARLRYLKKGKEYPVHAIARSDSQQNWPAHLGENRYQPERIFSGLRLLSWMYPRHDMHMLGLFVRAYAWYSGAMALCSRETRRRILDDLRDFKDFGVLPEYMNRVYEVKIPRGLRAEPTAAGP